MRKRHPDFSSAHQELDIHRVGMPGSNRHDHGLINAMDLFLGPAIGRSKIFKHVLIKTIADHPLYGQTARTGNEFHALQGADSNSPHHKPRTGDLYLGSYQGTTLQLPEKLLVFDFALKG